MEITALQTPVQVDTAIAAQQLIVANALRLVSLQERYLSSNDAHTYIKFDEVKYAEYLKLYDTEIGTLNELQALYTGWTRYYHVTNNNGHIHTSMNCTSCFPSTQYSWRTDLSGASVMHVIDIEAYNACSVCMPIAPAVQQAARKRYNEAQRQAKRDERSEKAAEKLRKAAERAQKLMVKVDAAYEALGGVEAVRALPSHGDGSLYHMVYGFGQYADRKPLQDSVANVILEDEREARGESRYDRDPRKIIAQAREQGLI